MMYVRIKYSSYESEIYIYIFINLFSLKHFLEKMTKSLKNLTRFYSMNPRVTNIIGSQRNFRVLKNLVISVKDSKKNHYTHMIHSLDSYPVSTHSLSCFLLYSSPSPPPSGWILPTFRVSRTDYSVLSRCLI